MAAAGAFGPEPGRGAVVVELDGDGDTVALEAVTDTLPAVVIGVGQPGAVAPDLDVLLTDATDPPSPWVTGGHGELCDAIEASPHAALVLVQLLRLGRRLDVPARLVAESLAYGLLQGGEVYQDWLRGRHGATRRRRPVGTPVLVERDGATLHVTLHRTDVHNALDTTMRDALVEALLVAELDPSIEAVELRGAGPSFCSGGDLEEFGTVPDPVTGHVIRSLRSPALAMWAVHDRVHAHLHGSCVGAGIELAAMARRVTARAGTTIRLPEVGFGLVPGAGGTASLPGRIGRARTAWLALTGRPIGVPTALAWGLVDDLES
jgi:hypothetical protein